MTWLDNLNNISVFDLNTTEYSRDDLGNYIIEKNKETSGGWWLNLTTICLFMFGVFAFARKNGLSQAVLMSSYCTFMVSITFILMGWSIIIYPFFLFGLIWTSTVIWVYNSKESKEI